MGALYCCQAPTSSSSYELTLKSPNTLNEIPAVDGPTSRPEQKETIKPKEEVKEIKPIGIDHLKSLFEEAKGTDKGACKTKLGDNYIYIDCRSQWTMNALKNVVESYSLPKEILGIGIGYLDEKNELIKQFIQSCIAHQIEWIWINYIALDKYEKQYRLGIDEYMESILSVLPKVTKWVGLNYFKMDSKQISTLISSCKNVKEKIDFDNSSLKIDGDLDFGKEPFQISKISMEDSFVKCKKGKDVGIKLFIQAIAQSQLKNSLKEICRSDCNVESEVIERILQEEKLTNIKVQN